MNRLLSQFRKITTTTRIAFAMAMWSATILLILRVAGVIDDGQDTVLRHRARISELVAVNCSQAVSKGRTDDVAVLIQSLRQRNPEVISVAIRDADGNLSVVAGDHKSHWDDDQSKSTVNRIEVPVFQGQDEIAKLELVFEPLVAAGLVGFLQLPSVQITLLACLLNFIGFSFWLKRCFRQFDPSQVVPERVRNALDTMAEVVMVVDEKDQIMFANRRLSDALGVDPRELQGQPLSSLPWDDKRPILQSIPTDREAESGTDQYDCELILNIQPGVQRVFKLNQSPIVDETGVRRGTLMSLDDITVLRQQHNELQTAMEHLEKSQVEIAEQNEQLKFLATRDSMTKCFNRRAFFESFEKIWHSSQRYNHPLACIMVDVDHFKSVNDNHGHAVGDQVLKQVAAVLLDTARDSDIVCRYGGEEFCVLLPHVDLAQAELAAERCRAAISALAFDQLSITASLGCSDLSQGAELAEAMLDQADQALYHAKRIGRNRVCRFDQLTKSNNTAASFEWEASGR